MSPRDLFGVVVRGIGVWTCIQGVTAAYYAILKTVQIAPVSSISPAYDRLMAAFYLALGLGLIVLADYFVRLIYGARRP